MTSQNEFERDMELARQIMEDRWEVLRALALSDQHPEADVETLLKMASDQKRDRAKQSK